MQMPYVICAQSKAIHAEYIMLSYSYDYLLGPCDRDEKRQRRKVKWLEPEEKDWDKAEWKDWLVMGGMDEEEQEEEKEKQEKEGDEVEWEEWEEVEEDNKEWDKTYSKT